VKGPGEEPKEKMRRKIASDLAWSARMAHCAPSPFKILPKPAKNR
jgi:hypothetical protein